MEGKRRKFKSSFKAQVAVEALKGDQTVVEIAQRYGIHPTLVNQWKKRLLESAPLVFDKSEGKEPEVDVNVLYRKIGQLEVERDFLASRPEIISLLKRGKP